jgi:hypothetical protein
LQFFFFLLYCCAAAAAAAACCCLLLMHNTAAAAACDVDRVRGSGAHPDLWWIESRVRSKSPPHWVSLRDRGRG